MAADSTSPELKKVHFLIVLDSAPDLASSLRIDDLRIRHLLRNSIPPDRYSLTTIQGESKVTRDSILTEIRRMRCSPGEGLVVYYGGHGAIDQKTGKQFFLLHHREERLYRDEVRSAMLATRAELAVLLSDCCSNVFGEQSSEKEETVTPRDLVANRRVPPREVLPSLRCLLFQSRGLVDITAAHDDYSYSDPLQGGLFTRSFYSLLRRFKLHELDMNQDGFLSWREFHVQLQRETQSLFTVWRKDWVKRSLENENRIKSPTQTPRAYSLGNLYAVVEIHNRGDTPLVYRARWSAKSDWSRVVLRPDEKRLHFCTPDVQSRDLPKLQIQLGGSANIRQLPTVEWSGIGEPRQTSHRFSLGTVSPGADDPESSSK